MKDFYEDMDIIKCAERNNKFTKISFICFMLCNIIFFVPQAFIIFKSETTFFPMIFLVLF